MPETSRQPENVYWTSRVAGGSPAAPSAGEAQFEGPASISRRRFLEAAGFTIAAASGCSRAPETTALPLPHQPAGLIPGRSRDYASTCAGCAAGCGLLVGTRDGRPLKMEGMPEHPLSHGGLCAVGQALPLELYDSRRLDGPLRGGQSAAWEETDAAILSRLDDIRQGQGGVRFVTSTVTSPTLQASIDAFLRTFDDARHVVVDPVSSSAILEAHERTHGVRLLPHYRFDDARVIVSLGADFLGTWISPVEFTAGWRTRRIPSEASGDMSWHCQIEGRMSLTGSKADRRYRVAPDEYGLLLSHVAVKIAQLAGQPEPGDLPTGLEIPDSELDDLVERMWAARGECLVLSDSQDVAVQVLVNYVNHLLDAYGHAVDIERPSRQKQGNDAEVARLVDELGAGAVSGLFVAGTDLAHCLPGWEELRDAVQETSLVVSCAGRVDELAAVSEFVCPDHHPLESWLDAEPVSGLVSLSQPTLQPLKGTRSLLESLAIWSGESSASAYEILRGSWEERIVPRALQPVDEFVPFWDKAVHDGFVQVSPESNAAGEFEIDAVELQTAPGRESDYLLSLYTKVGMPASRHAHNPWLQELPDPISKVVWDNYVCLSPAAASELGITDGDVVRVATGDGNAGIELPAVIQPGQHDRVVAIALNYGCLGTDRFAGIGPDWLHARPTVSPGELVGKNAAPLIDSGEGTLRYDRTVTLEKTGRQRKPASTQDHHFLEVPSHVAPHGAEQREPIQEATLGAFRHDPAAGAAEIHHFTDEQLWAEDHPKDRHRWGLVVDLNACTGCSACVIACQSENNVPVVGRDEVARKREMHWIRLDRYYSGDERAPDVSHQPMMCQHCDNAPCETVCPVLATVHSSEGLNEQAYNRCVGTRYCANNCPYKVRRFNWFEYAHDDLLQNLALNPDVTVRGRGVMEKCSMCVQRIEDAKVAARRLGEPLQDGVIQTACQQSCPAQAITFGDMNGLKFLFDIPVDPKTAESEQDAVVLDKRGVVDALRERFQGINRPLPEDVQVTVLEEGREWRIVADSKGFIVQRTAEALTVSEESRVRTTFVNPRQYGVLEEFNFRPSVGYLRLVRNRDETAEEGEVHG